MSLCAMSHPNDRPSTDSSDVQSLCALASHVVDEQDNKCADAKKDGVMDVCRSGRDVVELVVRDEVDNQTPSPVEAMSYITVMHDDEDG